MAILNKCPGCCAEDMQIFYKLQNIPVHSVLLMPSREIALNYPKGELALGLCPACGFISNLRFDPQKHEYSEKYEETQGFSPTFNTFHRELALKLIERYGLRGKDIIEIGCGKGEFLTLLCELGDNHGIGFDPAFVPGRIQVQAGDRTTFIQDFYSEKYSGYRGDFYCCKMTLEHIQQTGDFVRTIRHALGDRPEAVLFFQVPDAFRILQEQAFWDIYYEHCSYFSLGSLARLFRASGFDVVDLWRDYDDQYLMLAAKPGDGNGTAVHPDENDLEKLKGAVAFFARGNHKKLAAWKCRLQGFRQAGKRVVLWGAGSKAVAFLTTLDIQSEIEYGVDINPHKRGTFLAGTGQEIVSPSFMMAYRPDVVIVMNPIYREEIRRNLAEMGLTPLLIDVHTV